MATVVYFVESACQREIKVGFTTNIRQRLSSLRDRAGGRVRLIGSVPGGRKKERHLHWHFHAHRIDGEWFKAEEVRAPIDRLIANNGGTSVLCHTGGALLREWAFEAELGGLDDACASLESALGIEEWTTWHWISGRSYPTPEQALALEKATGGYVRARVWGDGVLPYVDGVTVSFLDWFAVAEAA